MSNEPKPNCPSCQAQGDTSSTSGGVQSGTPAFTMCHTPDITTLFYHCTRGHSWMQTTDPRFGGTASGP